MKIFSVATAFVAPLIVLHHLAVSCERFGEADAAETGILSFRFDDLTVKSSASRLELPDTCDFLLSITDPKGKTVYDGFYGDCPETLELPAGSYTIRAVSCDFSRPAFDAPQFGDEQCVVVRPGLPADVSLLCSQLNAGVSLDISPSFLSACPESVLFLKSDSGKLMYSYSERRIAYFPPGQVSLVISDSGKDEVLMTRDLQPREMVSVKLNVAVSDKPFSGCLSMRVDTSRVWNDVECVLGTSGTDASDVMTVAQARSSVGKEDVWVSGYVVGGDLTSASASFEPPFKSRTCLLLGPRSSTVDKSSCLSVQLPEGDVRETLNLVDNRNLLRTRVCVRGDLVESYYGIAGLKNTSEYYLM